MSGPATSGAGTSLRDRAERFSLLRSAHRAMARCMHPAALDPLGEQARQLLIRLQAAEREQSPAAKEVQLGEIDGLRRGVGSRTMAAWDDGELTRVVPKPPE